MKLDLFNESDFERRRRERAVRAGGDIEDVGRILAQLRRGRGDLDLSGRVDPDSVEKVRRIQSDYSDDWVRALAGRKAQGDFEDAIQGFKLAGLALDAEHFPLDELDDFLGDPRCTRCGSDRVIEWDAAVGAPSGTLDFGVVGGVVINCVVCDHLMFFKPESWPLKGYRDEVGDWVWGEGFVPLMVGEVLFEAGMNRRDFLKFLGKAGAAAYGAPLGKLDALSDPSKLLSKAQNVRKWVLYAPTFTHYGRGKPPTLTNSVRDVLKAFNSLVNLTGSRNILAFGDEDYEFGVVVDENQLKQIAKKAGWQWEESDDVEDNTVWFNDVEMREYWAEPVNKMSLDPVSPEVVINPLKRWVEDYAGWDMHQLLQTPKDLEVLETYDLEASVPEEMQSMVSNVKENIRDQIEYKNMNRPQQREVGYERQGQFDPRSARTAEPVGPFEDLLKASLDKLI